MEEKFLFRKLDSPEDLQEAYRLRFQVYCNECNFIQPQDYPLKLETDRFDADSVHFGGFDQEGNLVGAVRLILSSCGRFPIEEHCPSLNVDLGELSRGRCGEISRLTISKLYRRRSQDGLYYEPQVQDQSGHDKGAYFVRRVRPMAFGLYRAMYQESKRLKVNYWFALMERTLWMLLKIHGFVFKPVGPEVDFYGMVTPYLADITELEKGVHEKFPQFFDYFIQDLEPALRPKF